MPKQKLIEYDWSSMVADDAHGAFTPRGELPAIFRRMDEARSAVRLRHAAGEMGFYSVPDRQADLRRAELLAAEISKRFSALVVIGIGGSDLGARAVIKALKPRDRGMEVRFIGSNTDPEELADLADSLDWKKTAFNVVSKSGDTVEPMSAFLFLRDRLIRKVGRKAHAKHVVATTDEAKGALRKIAEREGYRTLPVPRDVGGRFSVLTPVGLFPAACAGVKVRGLLDGARSVRDDFETADAGRCGPLVFAGLHWEAYLRRSQHITALMPYAESLREFAFWFRQLWAESLGKHHDRQGKAAHHGPTPLAALGATDQHSQLQLYNEGPYDKIITLIGVRKFRRDMPVPKPFPEIDGVSYMGGHRFGEIINAELKATAESLRRHGRPCGTISLSSITPESLGALFFFFELATAVMGEVLDIDAFNQPGVEESKRLMFGLLGRPGFEDEWD
jgi:glucose-6-phosphate isomerase